MSENFTPGEWEVVLNEVHDGIFDHLEYHIWKCGENRSIVQFETWDKTRFAESKANAHLIATAPDLYNALKDLVGNSRENWQEVNVSKETIDNALKALNKARGEK